LTSLNVQQGIARIGGKQDAYRKQLLRFREHYANASAELQRLMAEESLLAAEHYCHSLKGVSGIIGADALHKNVTAIDDELKQGRAPEPPALHELEARLQAVLADIDSLQATAAAPASALIDDAELCAALEQLAHALEHDLGAAESLLARLTPSLAAGPWAAAMAGIAQRIDAFDIDAALSLVNELQTQIKSV